MLIFIGRGPPIHDVGQPYSLVGLETPLIMHRVYPVTRLEGSRFATIVVRYLWGGIGDGYGRHEIQGKIEEGRHGGSAAWLAHHQDALDKIELAS